LTTTIGNRRWFLLDPDAVQRRRFRRRIQATKRCWIDDVTTEAGGA
jgi:hypothetical protein